MLSLHSAAAVRAATQSDLDPHLLALLAERYDQLTADLDGDPDGYVQVLIVEPEDTLSEIEDALGFSPLVNFVDGAHYGEREFTPSWEWLADHDGWFELVFVLSDDGAGALVFVPDHPGVDPELLSACVDYAAQSADS